jgi:hypothetical protein
LPMARGKHLPPHAGIPARRADARGDLRKQATWSRYRADRAQRYLGRMISNIHPCASGFSRMPR